MVDIYLPLGPRLTTRRVTQLSHSDKAVVAQGVHCVSENQLLVLVLRVWNLGIQVDQKQIVHVSAVHLLQASFALDVSNQPSRCDRGRLTYH